MPTRTRSEKLDLRISPDDKAALAAAAVAEHRSVSEFVLVSALARANETLAERREFGLSASEWSVFQTALDGHVRDLPRMRKLLEEPGAFEQ